MKTSQGKAIGERVEICVSDQACSVKMAGYWPSCFLFELDQYPAILTKQA